MVIYKVFIFYVFCLYVFFVLFSPSSQFFIYSWVLRSRKFVYNAFNEIYIM